MRISPQYYATARDWYSIEKLYVLGEVVGVRDDGSRVRRYPSIRQLSAEFAIARSVLGNRARRGQWAVARARFQELEREAEWQRLFAGELAYR